MPEDVKPTPAAPASPAPAGQPAAATTVPEKFKDAKVEDVIKAYTELESKYGEQGSKLGALSEYEKYGSTKDVGEAIQWARDTYAKIQSGQLTPEAGAAAARPASAATAGTPVAGQAPWQAEGWDFLPPSEQAAKMSAYNQEATTRAVMEQVQKIATEYGNQIQGMRQTQSREQSIMFKALQAAVANGGKIDLAKVLENAAAMANKPPEELIDMAVSNMLSPDAQKAEVERQVTARLAEEKQKRDNENVDALNRISSPQPRFATKLFENRNAENATIAKKLQEQGISW